MFSLAKDPKWHLKTGIAAVLFVFALVHFFYDPYTVTESIAASTDEYELRPGDPEVRLAVLPDVKPGEVYKVTAQAAWGSVEAGSPSYKQPRVVFLNYNKQGRWIPSPFSVCGVKGSGKDSFETVLSVPEGAVSTRLVFQHRGKTGWIRLFRFSLQQVALKKSAPMVFGGVQAVWFLVAGWTIWRLRLMRRWAGIAVVLVAGLIAAGMLLPGKVVRAAPDQMADFVRPAQIEEVSLSARALASAGGQMSEVRDQGKLKTAEKVESRAGEVVQDGRRLLAREIDRLNFNLLGHVGLFLLLGATCGVCFNVRSNRWVYVLRVFAGGVVYALAAELLQVTVLTRNVQCSDIGVNVLGWLIGLALVALFARKNTTVLP